MCFWLLIRILRLWWSCNIDLTRKKRNVRRPHYPDLTNVQATALPYSSIYSFYTALYLHFFKSHDNECLQQHTNLPVCLSFFSTKGKTQTASCVLPAWSRPFLTHNMDLFFLLHILYSVWLLTTDIIVLCMFHHTYNQIKYCIVRGYLHGSSFTILVSVRNLILEQRGVFFIWDFN